MTCNPNWKEIKEHLLPMEETQNRPDLMVRVFHAKLEELKEEILKKHVFGEIAAYTYVIEYQKRGLPHAHFLLILQPHAKLFRPEEYDRLVSAELPDESTHPYLHSLVVRHMMHGPCGVLNPGNVCMQSDNTCRSSFPKEFCQETTDCNDAYPRYRRRNNGRKVKVRGVYLDNRWVVSYPPYLVAKLDFHINLEICSAVKAVKYIYKYICKGNDKILYKVSGESTSEILDEIEQFVSGRWISAPEALWRIFRFSMGDMRPAVVRLPLHLENYQPLVFKKKQKLTDVLNNPVQWKTMLTEFFYMNKYNSDAKRINCTYAEFPDHFVWVAGETRWKLQTRGDSVGRIVSAHPSEGERYYMRILLASVRCPTSFDDIKINDTVKATTYREAALSRGLLQDDNSQQLCMEEASLFHMPYELRRLFANLLVYSCPNNPKNLWLMFKEQLSEDYKRDKTLSTSQIKTKVLKQINDFLQSMGKHINTFAITEEPINFQTMDDLTKELQTERNIPVSIVDLQSIGSLNQKQKEAYTLIMDRVYQNKKGAFFLDGPGGTGKTYLYRAMLAELRSKGYIALATATSGIAASILPGGRTAHSRFKIPIDESEGSTCRVSKQSSLALLIKECKLIIWDEAPTAKRSAIEALNALLQDVMGSRELFGGKVVVLGGDFRQTLPVVKLGTANDVILATLISSNIWPELEKIHLTENIRALNDPEYTRFILDIGNGRLQDRNCDNVTLPSSILLQSSTDNEALNELIHKVYPNIHNPTCATGHTMNRAILTTKNSFVDDINQIMIHKFPGTQVDYFSFDEATNPNDQGQYIDIMNSLTPNGLPPHHLILKQNAPIILLRNLDPTEGLCNGTRLLCRSLQKNVIHAEIVFGDYSGKHVFIHRIPLQPPKDDHYPVPYKRTQFPVRLSFAMTINKAQGQTLDYVGIYLKEPVFGHGQLYVALSRARTSASVQVVIKAPFYDEINADQTKNVVYKQILNHA